MIVFYEEADVKKARERNKARREHWITRGQEEEEDKWRLKRQVLKLISSGQVGKAESRINSNGIASMSDHAVRAQLASKYPYRGRDMPDQVCRNLRSLLGPPTGATLSVACSIYRDGLSATQQTTTTRLKWVKLSLQKRAPGTGGLGENS